MPLGMFVTLLIVSIAPALMAFGMYGLMLVGVRNERDRADARLAAVMIFGFFMLVTAFYHAFDIGRYDDGAPATVFQAA